MTATPPFTGVIDADLKRVTAPPSPPPVIESAFIGEIRTENEYPTAETIDKLYDQLDFQRACQAFLRNITASSMYSFRQGLRRDVGATTPQDYVIWDGPFDANSLLLTPNSETVYGLTYLALDTDGPTVIEVPPGVLGVLNDMWMREVTDIGMAGPDHGQGGSYLVLPPGYEADVPDGYFVARPRTYGVWLGLRAFRTPDGDAGPAVATHKQIRIYPLARQGDPPEMTFVNASGRALDTIHPVDSRGEARPSSPICIGSSAPPGAQEKERDVARRLVGRSRASPDRRRSPSCLNNSSDKPTNHTKEARNARYGSSRLCRNAAVARRNAQHHLWHRRAG